DSPSFPEIPVEVQYTAADLEGRKAVTFDTAKIEHQLLGVAITAYKEARSSNLLPGGEIPEARREASEQRVEAPYEIQHSDWPHVTAQYGGSGDYVFAVSHVHIVKYAHVKLTAGSVIAENDAALQGKLEKAAARVEARFAPELDSLAGLVATNDAVWKVA